MSAGDWLGAARARLTAQMGATDAFREARLILQAATGWSAARVATSAPDALPADAHAHAEAMLTRRLSFEPLAQILGEWAFYGRAFHVSRDVLTPRSDTETLIDIALRAPFATFLDLGTGSGAIAVTLLAERPMAKGIATDTSRAALDVAARNAERHGVAGRLHCAQADWFDGITGQVDLIVSNPPYVSARDYAGLAPEIRMFEPRQALTPDGPDGLSAYRSICADAARYLTPSGRLIVEIGQDQGSAVLALFEQAGLVDLTCHTDINNKDRVVSGRRP
jgi:release factor glutamine methyltransferase